MRPATAKWPNGPKKSENDPRGATTRRFASINPLAKMSREAPLSVAERDFILESLRENVRLDGREADQFRPLNLSFGEEHGHVKLQLGKTRYVTVSFSWL